VHEIDPNAPNLCRPTREPSRCHQHEDPRNVLHSDPHGRNAEEFHLLSALGMSPLDAPRAGSSVDAELLGMRNRIAQGTVQMIAGSGHRSVPRPHAHGDQRGRICLKNRKVNLSHVRRADRGRDPGRRPDLARDLHALRFGLGFGSPHWTISATGSSARGRVLEA
jgi:hypothetical protein